MPTSSRVVVVTKDWSGLGLGILMQRQGSKVVFAYDFGEPQEKDNEAVAMCGEGLVDKLPLAEAILEFSGQHVLWVFDTNEHAQVAQRLIESGESVIGTSALSEKVENDRLYAAKLAKSVGMDLPETKEFSDVGEAVRFLEANKAKAFVYKPNEADATSTFVPQELNDPAKANELLREYILSLDREEDDSFVLQALVPGGTEANFEVWARDGKPIAAFLNLESKRKLTGDLGVLIGCAGGYVTRVPIKSKGVQQTAARYLKAAELSHYTGSIDANVILSDGKVLFLENCFRFGYNAYPELFYGLAKAPMERILREWIDGTGNMEQFFEPGFAGSLTLVSENCKLGNPILIPPEASDKVCLYQAMLEDGKLMQVGGWPEIACVVDHGRTIEETGGKCLRLAQSVSFPNKSHRIDLDEAELPDVPTSLPLSRYRSLQAGGYLR